MNVLVIHSQVSTCHSQVSLYIILYISTRVFSSDLDLDLEKRFIEKGLEASKWKFESCQLTTDPHQMATLISALENASEFKVLHFAMHGYEGKYLGISYTSELGTERYLSSNKLWDLIGDKYCLDGRVQCIFINACESKSIADTMKSAGFGGAIVSWEETVKNTIAADFARAFYAHLGRTKSLDFRKVFEDAKHVAEVLHTKHEAKREQNKEWFVGNGVPYCHNSGNESTTSNEQFDERSCLKKLSLISGMML